MSSTPIDWNQFYKEFCLMKKVVVSHEKQLKDIRKNINYYNEQEEGGEEVDEENTSNKNKGSSKNLYPMFIYSGPNGYKEFLASTFQNKLTESFSHEPIIQSMR
jgi:hypothetical protein